MKFPIFVVLCCLGAATAASDILPVIPDTSTEPPTTAPPTEPTTTPSTPISTEPTPDTSTKSTSTAPTPTTVPTTTPSTPAPTPPTSAPPTSTAKPIPSTTPKPAPVQPGNWTYFDKTTNQTCVMVFMAIQLEFSYNATDNTTRNVTHSVPSNANVTGGSCSNTTQTISADSTECSFTFTFTKEGGNFELTNMSFLIKNTSLENYQGDALKLEFNNKTFVTPLEHSYYCTRAQSFSAIETPTFPTGKPAKIVVSHVQVEAFHSKERASFSTAKDCDAANTPDIVPIAVGISLAGLVVVVLIAYLAARHRSQQQGYMSM